MEKNVVIAGFARSPFHFAHKGELTRVRPDELAAQTVRGLLDKTGVDPNAIEDLILGCALPEGERQHPEGRRRGLHLRRRRVHDAGTDPRI